MAYVPIIIAAVGAIQQGMAAEQTGKYNAAVSTRNEIISNQNAAQDSVAQAADAARKIGATRAAYAKAGVQLDEGSPLTVLAESARNAELDRQTIFYNGRIQAQGYSSQARIDRFNGASDATANNISGAASLLKDGYDIYSKTE